MNIGRGILGAALAMIVCATSASAQHRAEITPFVGYLWGNSISTGVGDVGIDGNVNYGVIVDFNVRPGGQVELSYTRQDTKLTLRQLSGVRRDLTDVAVNFFQIGGLGYVMQGQAQPFASFTLGATWYDPKDNTIDDGEGGIISVNDEWRFSLVFGLGVKYFPADRVGLRLQGHLYGTFLDTSGGLWCGFGGCSLGLFGAGIFQADLSGGLTIAVG